jgi:hypothetical protein
MTLLILPSIRTMLWPLKVFISLRMAAADPERGKSAVVVYRCQRWQIRSAGLRMVRGWRSGSILGSELSSFAKDLGQSQHGTQVSICTHESMAVSMYDRPITSASTFDSAKAFLPLQSDQQ